MAGRMTGSAYAALEVVFRLFLFTRGGSGGGKSPGSGRILGWRISPGGRFGPIIYRVSRTGESPEAILC